MKTITLRTRADVETALHSPDLTPPKHAKNLSRGATADLRSGMARFSSGDDHPRRRHALETAIDELREFSFASTAFDKTYARLSEPNPRSEPLDVLETIGFVVPTETLAMALGIAPADFKGLLTSVQHVAKVIGRGQPSTTESDQATTWLLNNQHAAAGGPVAAVSLLYQNHDATAALFAETVLAEHHQRQRRSAVSQTVRFADSDTSISGTPVRAGQQIVLDLEAADFEFGTGNHECPGREIATNMVTGMVGALRHLGFVLVADSVEDDTMGRPRSLPMLRKSSKHPEL